MKFQFYFLLILLGLSGCLAKEEGCLDTLATNFEANADESCDDCCSYPTLTLSITHAVGDTTLNYADTITVDNQSFRIIETSFYAYLFELKNSTETLGIQDTVQLTTKDSVVNTVTDDIQLISRNTSSFSYSTGTFAGSGSFTDFGFNLGLSPEMAATNPTTVSDTYPLSDENGLFSLPDSNYVFTRIRLINTTNDDTLQYDLNTTTDINLSYNVTVEKGENLTIPLKIDYLKWLEGINFASSQADNEAIIVQNLSNAFSITE